MPFAWQIADAASVPPDPAKRHVNEQKNPMRQCIIAAPFAAISTQYERILTRIAHSAQAGFNKKIERASGRRANIVQQGRPRKLNDGEEK